MIWARHFVGDCTPSVTANDGLKWSTLTDNNQSLET